MVGVAVAVEDADGFAAMVHFPCEASGVGAAEGDAVSLGDVTAVRVPVMGPCEACDKEIAAGADCGLGARAEDARAGAVVPAVGRAGVSRSARQIRARHCATIDHAALELLSRDVAVAEQSRSSFPPTVQLYLTAVPGVRAR